MTEFKDTLKQNMIAAMKEGNKQLLTTIRSINASIKQFEVDQREEADDAKIIEILEKARKQRLESIKQYALANREDLVATEQFELEVIESYLPEKLSSEEIAQVVQNIVAEVQPNGMADMGKVMAKAKQALQGKADMAEVSSLVKQSISSS